MPYLGPQDFKVDVEELELKSFVAFDRKVGLEPPWRAMPERENKAMRMTAVIHDIHSDAGMVRFTR